ncbi:hypothetical protein BDR05DRAFT_952689 [Suillus weaverae]|nr:hypothetical protein BDR05DRAFT_952689 [Suillus weaverae]
MCTDDRNNGVQLLSSLSGSTNIDAMHHFNTIYGACATASLMKSACLVKLLHTICSMLFAANIDLLSSEFILTHTQLQLQGHTGYKGASSTAMDVQRFIQLFGGLILHSTPHLYRSKLFSLDVARIAAGSNDRAVGCMHAHVDLDLDGEFCPAGEHFNTRAAAQARAEPKPAITGGFGPAWNFRKPKPSEARPKPRLSSQAGPEHH